MGDASQHPILAIDGGGTRCRAVYVSGPTKVVCETGPANVSSNFDKAIEEIKRAISEVTTEAGIADLTSLPAFVGLAGVTGPKMSDRVRYALPFAEIQIQDDRPAALRGALGRKDGVIAHCGTGSFFAGQKGDATCFAGGWGPVLGDEASAQWVGRMALQLTLETVDGRSASPLSEHLLKRFEDSAGVVRFASTALPTDFGALAPLVTEYAAQGDAIGTAVMKRGANEIERALNRLGWQAGQAICLTGGIGPHYATYLPDNMHADIADPIGKPLDGAISLAQDFAQEITNERC